MVICNIVMMYTIMVYNLYSINLFVYYQFTISVLHILTSLRHVYMSTYYIKIII